MKVAIAIPVKDEELRIPSLLNHLRDADADIIIFFDDYSEDNTVQMINSSGFTLWAHTDTTLFPPDSTRMSEKRNLILKWLDDSDYVLFIDADERFDSYFLKNIKSIIQENDPCISFAFRRVNLPGGFNYPDLQVRLVKNIPDVEWRGEVHDQLYSKSQNKPLVDFVKELDHIVSETNEYYCLEFEKYPIIHLPRRTDRTRPWW